MRLKFISACIVTWPILATAAHAHDASVTIYGGNQALVEDTRQIAFDQGLQTLNFPNVSSMINPSTVSFLAEDIRIIEQNFDFDLITPKKLMEKSLGQTVTLVRTNPGTGQSIKEKAKILSVNDGVVIQIGDTIEVLRDDNIPTRVIFDEIPQNLRAKPTLSVNIESMQSSERPVHFSYLTGGLSWTSDYIATFDDNTNTMNLQGWATITNSTETDFEDIQLSVVAGHIKSLNPQQRHHYNYNQRGPYNLYTRYNNLRGQQNVFRMAGTQTSPQEMIGNSYIYPLSDNVDLLSKQTKQIRIIEAKDVPAKRVYEYSAYGFHVPKIPVGPDVRIAFSNSESSGLSQALPQGTFRVFEKDKRGRSQFIGEDFLGHIPAGSTLAVKTGDAFDVKVVGRVVSDDGSKTFNRTVAMEYTFTNAKPEAVTVSFRQAFQGSGSHIILDENQESRLDDAYTRIWDVEVPAQSDSVLTFTVKTLQ